MDVEIEQIRLIIVKIHQRSFQELLFLSVLHVSKRARASTDLAARDSTSTYHWLSDLNSHADCRSRSRIFGKHSLICLYVCFNAEWQGLIVQRERNGSKASTSLCAFSERNSEWHMRVSNHQCSFSYSLAPSNRGQTFSCCVLFFSCSRSSSLLCCVWYCSTGQYEQKQCREEIHGDASIMADADSRLIVSRDWDSYLLFIQFYGHEVLWRRRYASLEIRSAVNGCRESV